MTEFRQKFCNFVPMPFERAKSRIHICKFSFMEENKIIIYQTEDGQTQIDVRLENDTVWLTTNQMASLFQKEESNIRRHIINLFN